MFIFWGTKTVIRKLGYVADFCPICREIQKFQLSRVGLASHVYGASFGEGKLVGHQKKCLHCGTELQTDPSIYKDVQKKLTGAGSTDLTANTFPNIRQHYSERLSLEEQLVKRPAGIDASTRAALIKEPFHLLAPVVEKRFGATHIDRYVGVALLLTIVGAFLVSKIFDAFFPQAVEHQANAVLITFGIGIVATGVQGYKSAGRYLRKEIYPKLAHSLRPLKPNQTELEAAFAELKRMGFKLPKKARLKDILQELTSARRQ